MILQTLNLAKFGYKTKQEGKKIKSKHLLYMLATLLEPGVEFVDFFG
jgi:hypothetical protein